MKTLIKLASACFALCVAPFAFADLSANLNGQTFVVAPGQNQTRTITANVGDTLSLTIYGSWPYTTATGSWTGAYGGGSDSQWGLRIQQTDPDNAKAYVGTGSFSGSPTGQSASCNVTLNRAGTWIFAVHLYRVAGYSGDVFTVTVTVSEPVTWNWVNYDVSGAWSAWSAWSDEAWNPATHYTDESSSGSRTRSRTVYHYRKEVGSNGSERNVDTPRDPATSTQTETENRTRSGTLIRPVAQTIAFNNPGTRTFGDAPFVLNAVASSGLPVSFSIISGPATISGSTLTITGAGSVTVRASQAGNASWNAAPTVDQTFTVNRATQAALTLSPLTAQTFNTTRSFTVGGGSGTGAYSDALASGSATRTAARTYRADAGAGNYVVSVTRAADANYNAQTSTFSIPLAPANQTITFANPGAKTYGDAPFALSASASSGLPVTFTLLSGPATISGSIVTLTGTGTVTVRASQAGNTNWNAATNVDQSFTVSPGAPAMSLNVAALAFGNVRVNTGSPTTSAITFRITNTGYGELRVSAISFGNADYTVIGLNGGAAAFPRDVPPGGIVDVTVMFNPSVIGSRNTTMTIANNTATPNAVTSVTGTGQDPALQISWPGSARLIP